MIKVIYPGLDTGLKHVSGEDITEEAFGMNFEEGDKEHDRKKENEPQLSFSLR